METDAVGGRIREEQFWKDLPAMTDYFSPAVTSLQKYLGIGSKEVMFQLGVYFGERASKAEPESPPAKMLDGLVTVWDNYDMGNLRIENTDPLTLVISDCRICGQLPGTGDMYECAFHQGFFQGALSDKLGKSVEFRQETNFEGAAGTWCSRLVADSGL